MKRKNLRDHVWERVPTALNVNYLAGTKSDMKTQTKGLLEQLDKATFFREVGRPLPEAIQISITTVISWNEALTCCHSIEWENYTLEQRNVLTMYLGTHAHDRYQNWNDIVMDVKKVSGPIAQRKALLLGRTERSMKKRIEDCINWDIMGACMELEYADIRVPSFFCWLMEFYLLGHFPCGWGERNNKGKILLYGPVEENDYDPNEQDPRKLALVDQERLVSPQIRMPTSGKLLVY